MCTGELGAIRQVMTDVGDVLKVRAFWVPPRSEQKLRCWYGQPWDPGRTLPAAWLLFRTEAACVQVSWVLFGR